VPTWVDTLLDVVTHPAVSGSLFRMFNRRAEELEEQRYERLIQRYDELEKRLQELAQSRRGPGRPRKAVAAAAVPQSPAAQDTVTRVRDVIVEVSSRLKEALRFARDQGTEHPEAAMRLRDAQQTMGELVEVERFELSPEHLATLPEGQRRSLEAALPTIRQLRQAMNEASTTEGLERAAALAGQAAAQLQAAVVLQRAVSEDREQVAVGCVQCGRAHLAGVATALRRATELAEQQGFGSADVQARIAFCLEELSALLAYDWTPEKISRNPEPERQALENALPRVQSLRQRLASVRSLDDLRNVRDEAQDVYRSFEEGLGTWTMLVPTHAGAGTHRISREAVERYTAPSRSVEAETTEPADPAIYFDRLTRALQARGVQVRFRNLPATPERIVEGEYSTTTNQIALGAASMSRDEYALQTLVHEAAHALLHNSRCLPHPTADQVPKAEEEAEGVSVIALTWLGVPILDRDGNIIAPGTRQVDWERLRSLVDETTYRDVRWASEWIVRVASGDVSGALLAEQCPALMTTATTTAARAG